MKKSITSIAIIATAGTAFAGSSSLLSNGGFETAGPGGAADSDQWTEFAGGAAGTLSERSANMPLAGGWSHEITAVGEDTVGAGAGINYNSISDGGLASLAESTVVNLSFDAETNFGPGGVGFYVLRILNGDGAIVADSGLQNLNAAGTASYGTSVNVPLFGGGANDTYAAFVEIVTNAGAFDGSNAFARIDNVSLTGTLIPAPAGFALMGLGGLVATRRRR